MSHTLNFNQLEPGDNFIHDPVITEPNAVGVFRAGQLFNTLWKWVFGQSFHRFDDPIHRTGRQAAQILPGGFFPLNAKGHCASRSV